MSEQWLPVAGCPGIDAAVCRDADTNGNGNCLDAEGSERLYYCTDVNMNVTSLVDASGTAQEHPWYGEPYGKLWLMNADWTCPMITWSAGKKNEILFAGYRYDPDANVYHVRHRVYHPTLGRWLQRDPIGYADGMDAYQYAVSRPFEFVDPFGLESSDDKKQTREEPVELSNSALGQLATLVQLSLNTALLHLGG